MGEPDPRDRRPAVDPTDTSMADPELGEYGAAVTFDSAGRVRQVHATVAGTGPFQYSTDQPDAPRQQAAPQTNEQHDARLRHDIDLLQQAIQYLQTQQDGAGIGYAMVTVLTMANNSIHSSEWVESEGLAEETRHWTAVTGAEGALETFQAAREQVRAAAEHLVSVLDQLLLNHDLVGRAIQRGARGGEALRHLAQVSAYARTRLSHTAPQTLHLLDEATTNLQSASDGDNVVRHVLSVLSMANNALLGQQNWEPALAAEYTAWSSLSQQSGTAEQFHQVRDEVLTAAQALRRELDQWQYHRVDASTAGRLAHPLVQAAEHGRGQLAPSS